MSVHVGKPAPSFSLLDQNGTRHSLSDERGHWVLLYFYPKDNTPGCTTEACGLRDDFLKFQNLEAVVLGVSVDSVESHQKFAKKYDLPFTLLSDTEKKVVRQYGVWAQKSFFGNTYLGTRRSSFLIDPHGVVRKIYEKVTPIKHAEEVLTDLSILAK